MLKLEKELCKFFRQCQKTGGLTYLTIQVRENSKGVVIVNGFSHSLNDCVLFENLSSLIIFLEKEDKRRKILFQKFEKI